MRRFIIEVMISVMMITVGIGLCFIEFSDYEYVTYRDDREKEVLEYTVDKSHILRLDLDDDLFIHFDYDETMGDQVEIKFSSLLEYKQENNTLKIEDLDWHWQSWQTYYRIFINGLKEHKLISFHNNVYFDADEIIITCSQKSKEWIDIYH